MQGLESKVGKYVEAQALKGIDPNTNTKWKRRNLLLIAIRDGKTCSHCHKPLFFLWEKGRTGFSKDKVATYDHVETKKDGGKITLENGVLACNKCNGARGHLEIEAFRKLLAEGHFTKDARQERKRAARQRKRQRRAIRRLAAGQELGLDKVIFIVTDSEGKTYINTVMKTFQAKIYVKNGHSKIPHTVQFNAETPFAAQQMLVGQYGANNVISVPVEVTAGKGYNSAPWMLDIG